MAAVDYYGGDDLYMLDSITGDGSTKRRPEMNSLYDCFVAIRDDEAEHAKTMIMMQEEMIQYSTWQCISLLVHIQ